MSKPPLVTAPILVDTREQDPLAPALLRAGALERLPVERATLKSGDYTVRGLEEVIALERKSLPDLWGTLFGGRDRTTALGEGRPNLERFRDELLRLAAIPRAAILVHGAFVDDLDGARIYCDGTPAGLLAFARMRHARGGQREAEENAATVMALLESFWIDYGVATVWRGGRAGAELYVGRALSRVWEQHVDHRAASKAAGRGLVLPWALPPASPDPRTTSPRIRHVNPNPAAHTTTRGGYTRGAPSR